MLFPLLLVYAAVVSAACARRGQPDGGTSNSTTIATFITTTTSLILSSTLPASTSASSQFGQTAEKASKYDPSGQSSSGGSQYTASFTHYTGCNTASVACGFVDSKTKYTAAISQNFFGAGAGAGAGPGCSKCWRLSSSTAGTQPITVKVNNLCPAAGNEAFCAQTGLQGTNSVGMNVNFDLCADDGTSAAFFGGASVGMTTGTATEVAC